MSNNQNKEECPKTENQHKEDKPETIYDTARHEKMSELDILRQSLEEKKKQAEEYYDQLLRMRAEFENYRRRTEKEKQAHLQWGKEEVLLKQLSLLDVLDQAVQSTRTVTDVESIKKGLELIRQEFKKMVASEGVTEIDNLGKKFDPHLDEAVEQVESEKPEGTIVGVLQKGYMFNGKVIRPAKVKVAAPGNPENKEGESEKEKSEEQESGKPA